MPRGMDRDAQVVWRRVLREMRGTGVITAADQDMLRAYCEAVASYIRSRKLLQDSGPLIRGARGQELVRNPLIQHVREERDAIRLFARELGLSPSARANLRIDPGSGSDDIDDVLGPLPKLEIVG